MVLATKSEPIALIAVRDEVKEEAREVL